MRRAKGWDGMEGEGTDSVVEGAEMVRKERTVAEKCNSQRRISCLRIRRTRTHKMRDLAIQ